MIDYFCNDALKYDKKKNPQELINFAICYILLIDKLDLETAI